MQIGIVMHEACFGSAVASVIDVLQVANWVRDEVDPSLPEFRLVTAAPERIVATTTSMPLSVDRGLDELDDCDVLLIPALGTLTADDTGDAMETAGGRAIIEALRDVDPERTRLLAACTGVFTVAETGHLDGKWATTSWFLAPAFRSRYPNVQLDLDSMVVTDGGVTTAGAAFAHIDLALTLLRDVSPTLAERVARTLLVDERVSQLAYVAYDHMDHSDPITTAFERYARQHLQEAINMDTAAQEIGTSRRTLERRLRQSLNLTPLGLVKRLRIQRARDLRQTTDLSMQDIALRVGYANAETLRALLRRSVRDGVG